MRRLLLLLLAYVAFDLADPVLPGAFSFDVAESEIEEVTTQARRPDAAPEPGPSGPAPGAPPATAPPRGGIAHGWAAPRSGVRLDPAPAARWPAARSALQAPPARPSTEDH